MSLPPPSNPKPIDALLSAQDNMHAIISQVASEALLPNEYELGKPTAFDDGSGFYNTSVVITSKTERFSGSDTLYYRRVDVSALGLTVAPDNPKRHIERPMRVSDLNYPGLLDEVCLVLSLLKTEFTLAPVTDTSYGNDSTHVLTAKPDSLLYQGSLGVHLAVEAGTPTPDPSTPVSEREVRKVVPGFFTPIPVQPAS